MAELFKVCMKDDDALKPKDEEKQKKPGEFSLDTDSEDAEDFEGIDVDVSIVDEKSAAVNAIGVLGCHSPELSKKCLKEMISALQFLHSYFHENVKFHVSLAYM